MPELHAMPRTVWKFQLDERFEQWVEMPAGSELLMAAAQRVESPQMRGEKMCVWARVNPSSPLVERGLSIVGTGNEAPAAAPHVGSPILLGGAFVFHVFDLGERPVRSEP